MSTINKVHTPCKKCSFAKYEENTQTGCFLDLLDKYRLVDVEVLEAYDNDKEFYIINGKKCAGYREQNYFDNRDMEEATMEEKVALIKSKLRMKYLAIIDCLNRTPEELLSVVLELKKAKVKPDTVMVIIKEDGSYSYSDYYKSLYKSEIGTKWKIKGNLYQEQDFITTIHQVVNLGAESCNFVLCVGADSSKVNEVVEHANDLVYEKFEAFCVVSNESKQTILFNQYVYKAAIASNGDIITDYKEYITV